jgi:hypothetical protein
MNRDEERDRIINKLVADGIEPLAPGEPIPDTTVTIKPGNLYDEEGRIVGCIMTEEQDEKSIREGPMLWRTFPGAQRALFGDDRKHHIEEEEEDCGGIK